jgi:titin
VGPDTTQYIDSPCVNGRNYHYAVTAHNFKLESNRSNLANATPIGRPWAPENLTATPGCGTVLLEWDHPQDTGGVPILGYRLHRGTTTGNIVPFQDLGNVTEYIDDTVENGRTYHFRLRAFNSLGNGTLTRVVSTMPVGPPGAPWTLEAVGGDGQVNLFWRVPLRDGGWPVLGYRVYRGTSEGTLLHIDDVIAPATSFIDLGVNDGITYYYRVLAYNGLGNGTWSQMTSAYPFGFPAAPLDLVVEAGDGQVNLGWKGPLDDGGSPIIDFIVYMGTDEGSLEAFARVEDTTLTITGLTNGETYYFGVGATNQRGEGPMTEITPAIPRTIPGAPTGLTVEPGRGSFELRWTGPIDDGGSPVTVYRIYRGDNPGSLISIGDQGPTFMLFDDDQVEYFTKYYYSVSAVNTAGEGARSIIASGTPLGPPTAPRSLEVEAGDGYVTLTWETPESDGGLLILGYVVLRGPSDAELEEVDRPGIVVTFNDTDVENGRTYHYSVLAYNDEGDGLPTSIKRAIPEGKPGPPMNVMAKVEGEMVTLTWSEPEDNGGRPITGYLVLRGTSPMDLQALMEVGTALSVTDEDMTRGRTYYYCVIAKNNVGQGARSQVVDAEVEELREPSTIVGTWIILVALVVVGVILAAGLTVSEPFKYRWGLAMAPLFSRISKEEVLDNKTRLAMHGKIVEHPGIHYSEIIREFDLSNGAAAYHLNVLVRENFIRTVNDGHRKRFYAKHSKVPKEHQMTPEEVRKEILRIVSSNPGISQKDIVDEMGRDRATVGYHLREMVKEGKLRASRKGQYTIYFTQT